MKDEMLGQMLRRRLEGRVSAMILNQMTNKELAEEYHYSEQEKIQWHNRSKE